MVDTKRRSIGTTIKATVTGYDSFGIFVTCEDGYSGLIHISQISSNFVKDVSDYAEIGQEINCVIIGVDNKLKRYSLSIKDIDYKMLNDDYDITDGFDELKRNLEVWMVDYFNTHERKENKRKKKSK